MASGSRGGDGKNEGNAKSSGSSLIGDIFKVAVAAGGALAVGFAVAKGLDALEDSLTQEEAPVKQSSSCNSNRTSLPPQPGENCPICLDEYSSPLEILPCQHLFHAQCISRWIEDHSTCPTCKGEISPRFKREYMRRMDEKM